MKKEITVKSLKRFNTLMGYMHLIQGILVIVIIFTVDKVGQFKIPLTTSFLSFDTASSQLVSQIKEVVAFPFAWGIVVFFLLSSFFHFLIVTPFGQTIYNRNLSLGMNPFRWYEYALSSSVMIALVAMLFGVYDVGSLILIIGLNGSMNLFGLLMEKMRYFAKKVEWSSFVFGCIAGIIPWFVIVLYGFGNSNPGEVPTFVYLVFLSYFVCFNLFPINMLLQYKMVGKWSSYYYGERGYIILSLVAKTLLAWLVLFGVMQP